MKTLRVRSSVRSVMALLILFGVSAKVMASDCDRDCVTGLVNQYVDALVAHSPNSALLTSSAGAMETRVTENGAAIKTGEGIWKTITNRGGYSQIFIDSKLDSAVFFGAFEEGDEPLLLAIRFKLSGKQFSEIENLVSRPDARNRLINAHKLTEPNPVYDEAVKKPLDRQQLINIGNAYFDGIQNSSDEGVPMDSHCNRRENGVLLLKNDKPETEPCPIGFQRFNYITDVRDRRIAMVDEDRGLVLIWTFFDVPGNVDVAPGRFGPSDIPNPSGEARVDTRRTPRSLYIAELFKVVDGNIRDVEAIMYNLDLGAKSGWE